MRLKQSEELTDGTFDPPGIDYEALAKAGYRAMFSPDPTTWENEHLIWREGSRKFARAVVAALRDQGLVVVKAEALPVIELGLRICHDEPDDDGYRRYDTEPLMDLWDAADAYRAALAAPGDGGEG